MTGPRKISKPGKLECPAKFWEFKFPAENFKKISIVSKKFSIKIKILDHPFWSARQEEAIGANPRSLSLKVASVIGDNRDTDRIRLLIVYDVKPEKFQNRENLNVPPKFENSKFPPKISKKIYKIQKKIKNFP